MREGTMPTDHEMAVTHLRDHLGFACQVVSESEEPIIVMRYRKGIAAIVPLWEWRFFKELEADIRAGRKRIIDIEESLDFENELAGTLADQLLTVSPDAGRLPTRERNDQENDDGEDDQEGPGEQAREGQGQASEG
jgi:PHD/YefM family antitoxin component YafN of YafNO toxin-antitoxin module